MIPLDLPIPTQEQVLKEIQASYAAGGLLTAAMCGQMSYYVRSRLTPFLECLDEDYGFTFEFKALGGMGIRLRLYRGDIEAIKARCAELGYEAEVREPPALEVKIEPGTYTEKDNKKWRKFAKMERFT